VTPAEAARLTASVLAAYPAAASKLTASAVAAMPGVWHTLLSDLTSEQANRALARHVAVSQWMPSVADLRRAALELEVGHRNAGGEAWGLVLRAIGRWGMNRAPGVDFVFEDPVAARCVDALGWRELCLSENQVADRARFVELYDQLAINARVEAQVAGLPGLSAPPQRTSPKLDPGHEHRSAGSLVSDVLGDAIRDLEERSR